MQPKGSKMKNQVHFILMTGIFYSPEMSSTVSLHIT